MLRARLDAFKTELQQNENASSSTEETDEEDSDEEDSDEENAEGEDGRGAVGVKDYKDKAYSIMDSPGTAFVGGDGLETVSLTELQRLREGPSVANTVSDSDSDNDDDDDEEEEEEEEDEEDEEDEEPSAEDGVEDIDEGEEDDEDTNDDNESAADYKSKAYSVLDSPGTVFQSLNPAASENYNGSDDDDSECGDEAEKSFSAAMFARLKDQGLISGDEIDGGSDDDEEELRQQDDDDTVDLSPRAGIADGEQGHEQEEHEMDDRDMIRIAFRELHNRDPNDQEMQQFIEMLEAGGIGESADTDDESSRDDGDRERHQQHDDSDGGNEEPESPSSEDEDGLSPEEAARRQLQTAAMRGHKGAQRELQKLMLLEAEAAENAPRKKRQKRITSAHKSKRRTAAKTRGTRKRRSVMVQELG